eukprot:6203901-Pleurochrysis_carterae.AAC.3
MAAALPSLDWGGDVAVHSDVPRQPGGPARHAPAAESAGSRTLRTMSLKIRDFGSAAVHRLCLRARVFLSRCKAFGRGWGRAVSAVMRQ